MKKDLLKNIEEICEKTRFFFVTRYFGEGVKSYWEGGKPCGLLHVGDFTFTLEEMFDFLKNSASRQQMFEYIEYQEEEYQLDRIPLSFHHYKDNLMRRK